MQILAILWQPNAAWRALSQAEQVAYLKTLDGYISAGRAAGMVVLGWSRIDTTLPRSCKEGYIGVFGMDNAALVHELEKNVQASGWYEYFDSTNVSIELHGATAAEPHRLYAGLLGIALPGDRP
jgi:hypothetical protein